MLDQSKKVRAEPERIVIRQAVIIVPRSIRLEVMKEEYYISTLGNRPKDGSRTSGTWFEWENAEGMEAFKNAGLLTARRFAIPASAVLGGDTITNVVIDWEKKFRLRSRLLASWVMEA